MSAIGNTGRNEAGQSDAPVEQRTATPSARYCTYSKSMAIAGLVTLSAGVALLFFAALGPGVGLALIGSAMLMTSRYIIEQAPQPVPVQNQARPIVAGIAELRTELDERLRRLVAEAQIDPNVVNEWTGVFDRIHTAYEHALAWRSNRALPPPQQNNMGGQRLQLIGPLMRRLTFARINVEVHHELKDVLERMEGLYHRALVAQRNVEGVSGAIHLSLSDMSGNTYALEIPSNGFVFELSERLRTLNGVSYDAFIFRGTLSVLATLDEQGVEANSRIICRYNLCGD